MKRKGRGKSLVSKTDFEFEEEIHGLADAITENSLQASPLGDPFEDYVEILRAKVHANPSMFRSRLVKGYHALLHALEEGME